MFFSTLKISSDRRNRIARRTRRASTEPPIASAIIANTHLWTMIGTRILSMLVLKHIVAFSIRTTRLVAIQRSTGMVRGVRARSSVDRLPAGHQPPTPFRHSLTRFFSALDSDEPSFQPGDRILVEILSFGPLGASVAVIGDSHDDASLIDENEPALGRGLILQREISYFRQARGNVDVVVGEVVPAYVERVREDGKLDVSLRAFGAQAKADELSTRILERLEASGGMLKIGDKSAPEEITREFPGVSKSSFKRAVAGLYRQGKVQPAPHSITLL